MYTYDTNLPDEQNIVGNHLRHLVACAHGRPNNRIGGGVVWVVKCSNACRRNTLVQLRFLPTK